MATSKHKMCCAEYRATIRSRWGFRASKWLQHHDGRAAGCTSIDHGKFCSSLSVRRGASLFFPCPQRRSTELWAREFQRSSPGSFGKTSKLSWTLKYEKPLPTCLKFQLRPKTLVFGPPLMLIMRGKTNAHMGVTTTSPFYTSNPSKNTPAMPKLTNLVVTLFE